MAEEWRTIPEWNKNYAASSLGRIKRIKLGGGAVKGRILKQTLNSLGYPSVCVSANGVIKRRTVHALVVDAFMPGQRTKGLQVNHIDGDKTNNRIENLEIVTRQQNIKHAVQTGLIAKPRKGQPNCILDEDKVRKIKESYREGRAQRLLAEDYGVSRHTINAIVCGRTWKHVA